MLLAAGPARAQNVSALGGLPDYRRFDAYQETITREDFTRLLDTVYAPRGGWEPFIRVDPDAAVFRKTSIPLDDLYTLRFGIKPVPPAYWRPKPKLAGLRVALDPGHLGGRWAKLEERWFQIGDAPPVMEGEMTLQTCRLLAARLTALGAVVTLVRDSDEPSTPLRAEDLGWATAEGPANVLFTRADIRARGHRINTKIRPDLVLCLHYNAEAWGDPAKPELVEKNHLHVLVNGCYGPDEIAKDDLRFEMLLKLLNRSGAEELALAERIAPALAAATGLPPFEYKGENARRIGASPFVWTRNLLANRLYECPVVFLEPYVMNSPEVFARAQAGDYEGTRDFGGVQRKSIFREYADAVAEGVAAYYGRR